MFFVYSVLYTISLVVLFPYFLLNREKYISGFSQRLGFLPEFRPKGAPVIWIHCVSVGETNAAQPLIRHIRRDYPSYRIVVSATTKTGYDLATKLFPNDFVIYFPLDLAFIIRRVMNQIRPNLILIMETEIWFNFFRESFRNRSRVVIVNGRLSQKSVSRYWWIQKTMERVLRNVDIALMQTPADAERITSLGIRRGKVKVTGNLKFDQEIEKSETSLTAYFKERFAYDEKTPLIIAASTHEPEETWVLEAFKKLYKSGMKNLPRLMIVPRHPERFDEVEQQIASTAFSFVRRSAPLSFEDELADVVLLDSIGELRSVYPLAEIVFVGGSLVPKGGQSILEPALAGKAIITGNFMTNFEAIAAEFERHQAFVRLPQIEPGQESQQLALKFAEFLGMRELSETLATNALKVMKVNRGATKKTLKYLKPFLDVSANVPGR